MEYKFDIDNPEFYLCDNKFKERTRERIIDIAETGMELTGIASFGYKDIMSGLYIEKVWNYSDKDFSEYMQWAKDLIKSKTTKCN